MAGVEAARFVNRVGFLLRQKYSFGDFSNYNDSVKYGINWGSRGVPAEVQEECGKHKVGTISLLTSVEQARDALANGYALAVCSNYGFVSTRDSKGFARPSGSWSHAMAWIACDDTGSEPAFLVQNSWGAWNSGGHPAWGEIPPGSFLITADVAAGMIRQQSCWAISNFNGFPAQKLLNWGATGLC